MNKPDSIIINVREYCGTYIASCKEVKVRASCTSGASEAVHACAYKVYGAGNFELKKVTDQTWTASAIKTDGEAPHGATTNGEARNRILALLAEINEVFEECCDLTIAEQVEVSIEMAEQAITRLGDATEDATSEEDAETIKRSFDACEKMRQELEDITLI